MIEALPVGLLGARDRALLLVAVAAALRCVKLVRAMSRNIAWHREGITVHLARSTTDQLRERADVPVRAASRVLCPVRALRTWLDGTNIVCGQII